MHLRNQVKFLKLHDKQTKRLWFLWNAESLKNKLAADRCRGKICGCVGGCNFFDTNINGVRFFTNQSLDAASEQNTHYGSESLWGGQTGMLDFRMEIRFLSREFLRCEFFFQFCQCVYLSNLT